METKESKLVKQERETFEFNCPHGCGAMIEVTPAELACKRMIHGSLRLTGTVLGPHSSRATCQQHIEATQALLTHLQNSTAIPPDVAAKAMWVPCGKAIHIIDKDGEMYATAVDYES